MSNPRAATSVHRRTPASNKNVEHKKAQEIGGGCYLRYKIQRKCWFVSVAFAFPNGYLELTLTKGNDIREGRAQGCLCNSVIQHDI